MNWDECWEMLKKELGRDPTQTEMVDKMLSELRGDKE